MTPAQDQRRRFFGDTRSLKSFGGSLRTSFSLKATSLKAKHRLTLVIPGVLSRGRRRTESGDSSHIYPQNGARDSTYVEPPLPSSTLRLSMHTVGSPVRVEEHTMPSRDKSQRVRNRTRSKTIIGLISKTFRPHPPPPSPTPPSPLRPRTQITSVFASREYRDAALRERGLLPPLKPNLDLSQAERRRDSFLPVLQPPTHEEELVMNGEAVKMSAASKIKQEWEATNKFIMEEEGQTSTGSPSPSRLVQDATMETPRHLAEYQYSSNPRLEPSSPRNMNSLFVNEGIDNVPRPFTPSDPHLVPLPSSPLEPSLLSVLPTHLTKVYDVDSVQPPLPMSPVPSNSSARLFLESSLVALDTPPASAGIASCEDASMLQTPGLPGCVDPSGSAKIKASVTKNKIPIIIESPVDEGSFVLVPEVVDEMEGVSPEEHRDANPLPVPKPQKARKRNMTDSVVLSEHKIEHRKSFNLFKRSQIPTPNLDVPSPEASPTKRLSVSASFSNIRRSFISTLSPSPSRPKLTKLNVSKPGEGVNVILDPSYPSPLTSADQNSPRSPMSPKSPGWSPLSHHRSSPHLAPPRKAVSPTFHSTGTILVETANIEDEEIRRVTELAFLG